MIRSKAVVIFLYAMLFSVVGVFSLPAHAQNDELTIEKKFLKPLRFTLGEGEPGKVYNFTGLSFAPGFQEVLEQDAAALAAAKKGFGYNGLALGGSILMVAGSALMLSNTIKDAQCEPITSIESQGCLNTSSDYSTPLALVVVGALASIIGSQIALKHLRNGVAIYNANSSTGALQPEQKNFQLALNIKRIGGSPGVGVTLSW